MPRKDSDDEDEVTKIAPSTLADAEAAVAAGRREAGAATTSAEDGTDEDGDGDDDEESDEDDDEDASDDDASGDAGGGLTQEELMRRAAALDGGDESDRIAEQEEAKLRERRAKLRKKGDKSALESAASRRLAKIGDRPIPKKKRDKDFDPTLGTVGGPGTSAADVETDPLLETTTKIQKWLRANSKTVSYAVGALALVAIGFVAFTFMQQKKEERASTELTSAIDTQRGRIGDPDKKDDPDAPKDPSPVFKTIEERNKAALAKYREVVAQYPGTGAAMLARLGEGGMLLDQHDAAGAIAAYEDVKKSPLAMADKEVRARAIEGIGLAYELKTQGAPSADVPKFFDDAIKAYKELETVDAKGMKELALYHQARCLEAKDDKARAKDLLKQVYEATTKPGENHPFPYLEHAAEERLRALDPAALPPKREGDLGMGAGGGKSMNDAQIKRLIEQMKKSQEQGGKAPGHP
ncbi:MAG: hypothetical protein U0169_22865 [Polyangiaceae bacterium]